MTEITDDYMKSMLPKAKAYCVVLLKPGPQFTQPGVEKIIWEHGRRNFAMRADGVMPIVCPVPGDRDICGVAIFNGTADETKSLMDDDPGVKAGVFVYSVHSCRSFPGDQLPF